MSDDTLARARRIQAAALEITDDEARALCSPWSGLDPNTLRIVKQALAAERDAGARADAWEEGWRAGADDQKVWSGAWTGDEAGFVGTAGVNPYRVTPKRRGY